MRENDEVKYRSIYNLNTVFILYIIWLFYIIYYFAFKFVVINYLLEFVFAASPKGDNDS